MNEVRKQELKYFIRNVNLDGIRTCNKDEFEFIVEEYAEQMRKEDAMRVSLKIKSVMTKAQVYLQMMKGEVRLDIANR